MAKASTKKKPKLEEVKTAPGAGHNSEANPQVSEMFEEYMDLEQKKKEIAKAQREIKARAKSDFMILSSVFAHEVKLRKLDDDVRIQFESGHVDLKGMLGYQASLDLRPGTIARTEEEYVDPSDPTAEANKLMNRK